MYALALNGTPKARAAFERARAQFLEAYKTNNIELSQVDRKSLENLWSKVQDELAKEKAEREIPNPEDAKRVWPPKPNQLQTTTLHGPSSAAVPPTVAAPTRPTGSKPTDHARYLWVAVAMPLLITMWIFLRKSKKAEGK